MIARHLGVALVFGLVVLAHVPADRLTGEKALRLHGPVVGLNLYGWPAGATSTTKGESATACPI